MHFAPMFLFCIFLLVITTILICSGSIHACSFLCYSSAHIWLETTVAKLIGNCHSEKDMVGSVKPGGGLHHQYHVTV